MRDDALSGKGPDEVAGSEDGRSELKVQTTFDSESRAQIEAASRQFRVSNAEVVRAAYRLYWWACQYVRRGWDIGAYEPSSGRFVAVVVPYATQFEPMKGTGAGKVPATVRKQVERGEGDDEPEQ